MTSLSPCKGYSMSQAPLSVNSISNLSPHGFINKSIPAVLIPKQQQVGIVFRQIQWLCLLKQLEYALLSWCLCAVVISIHWGIKINQSISTLSYLKGNLKSKIEHQVIFIVLGTLFGWLWAHTKDQSKEGPPSLPTTTLLEALKGWQRGVK